MELNGTPLAGAAQPQNTEAVLRAAAETLERTRELIDQTRERAFVTPAERSDHARVV